MWLEDEDTIKEIYFVWHIEVLTPKTNTRIDMKITDKITITNEDNMVMMARYPDKYFDIGITDTPYGIDVGNMSFVKERNTLVKQKNGNKLNPNRSKKLVSSDWDREVPREDFWKEFCRITRHQIFFGVEYVDWKLGTGRIKWNKGFADGVSFKPYEMAYCSFIDYEKEIDYLWAGMMQGKSITDPMIQKTCFTINPFLI